MKYYIVNSTILDGEYEYFSQHPVSAMSEQDAIAKVERDNKEWIALDYRKQEVSLHKEINEQEFNIVQKYIY